MRSAFLLLVATLGLFAHAVALDEPAAAVAIDGCEEPVPLYALRSQYQEPETPQFLPPPVPSACVGIRPGARIFLGPYMCSANWLFRNVTADGPDYYLGTAGHCGSVGWRVSSTGVGEFGAIAYSKNEGIGRDFALIKVDEDKEALVNPGMCHWGGPTGVFPAQPIDRLQRPVVYWGNGIHTLQFPPKQAREGVSTNFFGVQFVGDISGGDSGSAIRMLDGQAWGVITHGLGVGYGAAYGYGTSVSNAIGYVRRDTGMRLELVTAPVA